MKQHILSLSLALATSVAAISAGVAYEPATQPNANAASPKALYSCPIHPQIRWSKADNCPIRGMKLALAKTAVSMPNVEAVVVSRKPSKLSYPMTSAAVACWHSS